MATRCHDAASLRNSNILGRQSVNVDWLEYPYRLQVSACIDLPFFPSADPNDAFWLAQAHFLCHHYLRAESILTQTYAYQRPRATTSKGKEREDLLRGNMPLMGGIDFSPTVVGKFSRLVDLSVACRYLAAQCSVRDIFFPYICYFILKGTV